MNILQHYIEFIVYCRIFIQLNLISCNPQFLMFYSLIESNCALHRVMSEKAYIEAIQNARTFIDNVLKEAKAIYEGRVSIFSLDTLGDSGYR